MKRFRLPILAMCLVVLFGIAWFARAAIRDLVYQVQQPTVPEPVVYQQTTSTQATNTKKVPPKALPKPVATSTKHLPAQVNLAVPFLLQAPTHKWVQPYEDACEEASLIMIDAYYHGRKERYHEEDGNKVILDLVEFETNMLGKHESTSAEETARLAEAYFPGRRMSVIAPTSMEDIKQYLAQGIPVILPLYGKALNNPYFRNGGPVYHMLVVKGYLPDGRFITNDPGIGKGPNYIYPAEVLWKAIHDWNDGDVLHGAPKIIIMRSTQ